MLTLAPGSVADGSVLTADSHLAGDFALVDGDAIASLRYRFDTGAATPITYEAGGRQFVVIATGQGENAELVAFALR